MRSDDRRCVRSVPAADGTAILTLWLRRPFCSTSTGRSSTYAPSMLLLLAAALWSIVADFGNFASADTARQFFIAPLLTFASIPFLYVVALVMAYELVFMRIGFALKDENGEPRVPLRTRIAVFRACGLRLSRINRFSPAVMPKLFAARSRPEADAAIRAFGKRRPSAA